MKLPGEIQRKWLRPVTQTRLMTPVSLLSTGAEASEVLGGAEVADKDGKTTVSTVKPVKPRQMGQLNRAGPIRRDSKPKTKIGVRATLTIHLLAAVGPIGGMGPAPTTVGIGPLVRGRTG